MLSLFSLTLCSFDVKDPDKVVLNLSLIFIEYNKQGRRQRILNAGAEGVLDQWQGELAN